MSLATPYLERDFGTVSDLVRIHAQERPNAPALIHREDKLSWGELNAVVDRISVALQRDGIAPGDRIAICALSSVELCRNLPRRRYAAASRSRRWRRHRPPKAWPR